MGFLDIIKRGKNIETAPAPNNSLPELPQGIPEIPPPPSNLADNIPQYNIPPPKSPMPNTSSEKETNKELTLPELPDLGTDMEMPQLPKMPKVSKALKTEAATKIPNIPKDFPAPSAGSYVPDKVPPLEGLDVPNFKEPLFDNQPTMPETKVVARPITHKSLGPLFVKVSAFKHLVNSMDEILVRFKDEDDIFFRLTEVKNTQDKQFENFRQILEDMQRKLLFIDKTLFDR